MTGIGAILAACHVAAGEDRPGEPSPLWDRIHDAFRDVPEPAALALGRRVADQLLAAAQRTGCFATWAASLHHLPRPGQREAAAALAARLDAWAVPKAVRPSDDRRRRLARLAVQLVKARVPSAQVITRLNEANATLLEPVDGETVFSIAIWAAGAAGGRHA